MLPVNQTSSRQLEVFEKKLGRTNSFTIATVEKVPYSTVKEEARRDFAVAQATKSTGKKESKTNSKQSSEKTKKSLLKSPKMSQEEKKKRKSEKKNKSKKNEKRDKKSKGPEKKTVEEPATMGSADEKRRNESEKAKTAIPQPVQEEPKKEYLLLKIKTSKTKLKKTKSRITTSNSMHEDVTDVVELVSRAEIIPTNYFANLMRDERPDLLRYCDDIDIAEYQILDRHLVQKCSLNKGELIYTKNDEDNEDPNHRTYVRYRINLHFGRGRYSTVYLASRETEPASSERQYIIKTSVRYGSTRNDLRIARERKVLQELQQAKLRIGPQLFDMGFIGDRTFIVMTALGEDLLWLVRNLNLGIPSKMHLIVKTFFLLKELHKLGYVHRDIKLKNFCVGQQDKKEVYLIDYGDCVKIGKQIGVGVADGYCLLYRSAEQHMFPRHSTCRSDLESWYYMVIDLCFPTAITWRQCLTSEAALAKKIEFWKYLDGIRFDDLKSIGLILQKAPPTFGAGDYGEIEKILGAIWKDIEGCKLDWMKKKKTFGMF